MESKHKKITKLSILIIIPILLINLFNQMIIKLANRKSVLPTKDGMYYDWRFGKLFYTCEGEGSPILLIHELSSYGSSIEFHELIHQLSKKHTVYALDLLGCGRSEKPAITYTAYLYVQMINDFIKDVIKSTTDVMVSGKSSSIVMMACCTEESYYHNIMLINPENVSKGNRIPNSKHKLLKYLLECHTIGTLIYLMVHTKEGMMYKARQIFSSRHEHLAHRYAPYFYEAAHLSGSNAKYLHASLKAHYVDTNFIHAIKNVNNSIYMVLSDNEPDYMNTIEQYQVLNPAIEASVIDDSYHFPHLDQPKEILSICDILF
ncbi:MAG: alpha/beta fold hydrolase [Anaerostipes sp.]|uniref:alpha/beta fold hydrolase n=1 Tax=Anaerostipes sp. 992a TaxID=1261637 RepID=UPI0009F88A76|nr:alpha/beta fold hydrolase [Anaerostipes sp. 992a]MCI5952486.1 alpha/beta fold hydrolase [Anaerostipes sp.]MDD5968395.1 alpha/beta fold hydrolase [Anaerostipes sp.]